MSNVQTLLSSDEANQLLQSHGVKLPNGQVFLTKPMFVFKKVYKYDSGTLIDVIANLILPAGTVVNPCTDITLKMRASQALCWSLVSLYTKRGKQLDSAHASHDNGFRYTPLKKAYSKKSLDYIIKQASLLNNLERDAWIRQQILRPIGKRFDMTTSVCKPGIHFFMDLERAKEY